MRQRQSAYPDAVWPLPFVSPRGLDCEAADRPGEIGEEITQRLAKIGINNFFEV